MPFGSKGVLDWEYYCKIRLLDDTEITVDFKKESKGAEIFDQVCNQLDLLEKPYFGLRYVDGDKQRHWLDVNKNIIKQMKAKPPYTLFFRVKFYASGPHKVTEEITRYLFFLQIKRDILHGRLLCHFNDLAELGGYIMQEELGDYADNDNCPGYVSEFRIVPKQTEKLEKEIEKYHAKCAGLTPGMCEEKFLEKVLTLEMYGVDPHPCKDQDNVQLYLGLTPTGIAIIREAKKVSGFLWNQIHKVSYDTKNFFVQVYKDNGRANYGFSMPDHHACKHLYKCAVEHHTFYSNNITLSSATITRQRKSLGRFNSFKRPKHRYDGPRHDEVVEQSKSIIRPSFEIQRTGSIRVSRRRAPKQDLYESVGNVLSVDRSDSDPADHKDTNDNDNKTNGIEHDPLKEFETTDFPEVKLDDSIATDTEDDVTDSSIIIANHVQVVESEPPVNDEPIICVRPPPKPVLVLDATPPVEAVFVPRPRSIGVQTDDVEDTSAKNMLIFILVLLAILLVPIAIIWERRRVSSSIVQVHEKNFKRRWSLSSLFSPYE